MTTVGVCVTRVRDGVQMSSRRRVLVIGSQCDALPRLSFLPRLADELYEVLADPQLGACTPALPRQGPLHDPTLPELVDALERAFEAGDAEGAMLLLALVGHGIARGSDFYFLSRDASAQGRASRDLHLSQHLKELLRDSTELDGLVVLLDTCQSGAAARQALSGVKSGWATSRVATSCSPPPPRNLPMAGSSPARSSTPSGPDRPPAGRPWVRRTCGTRWRQELPHSTRSASLSTAVGGHKPATRACGWPRIRRCAAMTTLRRHARPATAPGN